MKRKNKISRLVFSKQRNSRVNLEINYTDVYSFPLDIIGINKLSVGQELGDSDLISIIKQAIIFDLYQLSLNKISIRPRSKAEIKFYLNIKIEKFFKKYHLKNLEKNTLINQIIIKLTERNFLNDLDFANWWINEKHNSKFKGKNALKFELIKKGIDDKVINQVLKNINHNQQKDQIKTLIDKISHQLKGRHYDRVKLKQVLTRRLLYKGFTYKEIKNQIDEYISKE